MNRNAVSRGLLRQAWCVIVAASVAFIVWAHVERSREVARATTHAVWSVDAMTTDPTSPTGWSDFRRRHIVPGSNPVSLAVIAQVQAMFAADSWRIRRVEAENAPYGRDDHDASLYAWWIALISWAHGLATGEPAGQSVEFAAVWADPLLHGVLVLLVAVVGWRFYGRISAALGTLIVAGLFPLAATFVPGMPESRALSIVVAAGTLLPLGLAVSRGPGPDGRRTSLQVRRAFTVSGIFAGAGLWLDAPLHFPVILGVALGAMAEAGVALWTRKRTSTQGDEFGDPWPWRQWGIAIGVTGLVAYLVEYAPGHLALHFEVNNPFWALAAAGIGEVAHRVQLCGRGKRLYSSRRDAVAAAIAAAAVIALPVALALWGDASFWKSDPFADRLSGLGPVAGNGVTGLVATEGLEWVRVATLLPLVLLGLGMIRLFRLLAVDPRSRQAMGIAFALGPLVLLGALGFFELRWWALCDLAILLLVVLVFEHAVTAGSSRLWSNWPWLLTLGISIAAGFPQIKPPSVGAGGGGLAPMEATLIERDLAAWLARRAGEPPAIVLAAPPVTSALSFYGDLRGVGTLDWENGDGLAGLVRIVSTRRREEARLLLQARQVRYIVDVSWDAGLEALGRVGRSGEAAAQTFMGSLRQWALPPWLRPLPYRVPDEPAFAGMHITVFEVVESDDEIVAASRLVEYFLEQGDATMAAEMAERLRQYANNVSALAAFAQVEAARGQGREFQATLEALAKSVARDDLADLPWDRRVSVAAVFAQGRELGLARSQMEQCLREISADNLRSLTTGSLVNFLRLLRVLHLEIADAELSVLARELLRPDLRAGLVP